MAGIRVALWGPTGSGKSWLIQALNQELINLSESDTSFDYLLLNEKEQPLYPRLNSPPSPTEEILDHVYIFRTTEKSSRKVVSNYILTLHDNKGKSLLEPFGQAQKSNIPAELTLSKSNAIISLFDAAYQNYGSMIAEEGGLISDQGTYARYTYELCNLIAGQAKDHKPLFAACVSKIDLFPNLRRNPLEVFQMLFPDVVKVLDQFRDFIEIRHFSVSSMGFIRRGGRVISNSNGDTGTVQYPEKWVPYNITSPFFWFFNVLDKRSGTGPSNYPAPLKNPGA